MAEWPEGSKTVIHYGVLVTGNGEPGFLDYESDSVAARQAATMEPEPGQTLEFGHCEVTYGPFAPGEPDGGES